MASTEPPQVRIVNASRVPLSPPPGGVLGPLSLFDTIWILLPPMQRLFLYPDAAPLPLGAFAGSLRSALARTLPLFHPLAGELTYLPASGDAVVDCSPSCFGGAGPGVTLVEAESDADIRRLAQDPAHDAEAFHRLVPHLRSDELPAAVMAIQVTEFVGGGVAVGIATHHTVMDGKGVWRFLEALAAANRGAAPQEGAPPVHNRSVLRIPGGEEAARGYLKLLTPDLPRVRFPADPSTTERFRVARRTFVFDAAAIQSLKQRAACQTTGATAASVPSTFVALSAHVWISVVKAKGLDRDEDAGRPLALVFLADCRAHLDPPVPESFTGNCVRLTIAQATGAEITGAGGLTRACEAIRRAVREVVEEPLKRCDRWLENCNAVTKAVQVAGSPRFRAYDVDFGWGRPGRSELVSMNNDGGVVLVAGKEEGSVQVSMSVLASAMEEFARAFVEGLED